MSTKIKKTPVNTKLHEDKIYLWHKYAVDKKLTKEDALAEIITKGTKQ